MNRGRRLGFDYGDVRIGVAMSDPDSILATPLTTLSCKNVDLWEEIALLIREFEPIQLFVGRPMHLAGHESQSTLKAEEFAQKLRERFNIAVDLIDERFSTVNAQRILEQAGVSARDSKAARLRRFSLSVLRSGMHSRRCSAHRRICLQRSALYRSLPARQRPRLPAPFWGWSYLALGTRAISRWPVSSAAS